LLQVMSQVNQVILDQVAQRDRLVRPDLAWHRQCGLRDASNSARQVMIV
jgi:hypothetical protein